MAEKLREHEYLQTKNLHFVANYDIVSIMQAFSIIGAILCGVFAGWEIALALNVWKI